MLAQLAVLGVLVAHAAGAPAATHASGPQVRPVQEIAVLLATHPAFTAPRRGSARLRLVSARRPITNGPTVLPVVGHAKDTGGRRWLRVRLPGRPNGSVGWIEQAGTRARTTEFRLVVDISRRRVTAYRQSHVIGRFRAIVGRPSTPTPLGEYFVEEAVALPPDRLGAPFALALSARSDVYQEFDGGPGQIALHGLTHVGGSLGTAASHGCVRLGNTVMRWLVQRVGPGVPVTILA